ncbi:MAG TPA: M3 family oligoendopeptidase [Thermomicrobiales bacterium]|nr:M3 family oligoendopeptidase [Thermomicrobiales bacterium]
MTLTKQTLPRWDMSVVYPSLDSPEFELGFAATAAAIEDLAALLDRHGVGCPAPSIDGAVSCIDELIERFNAVLARARTLDTYIYCHIAADSRDDRAQAMLSEFDRHDTRLSQLATRFTAWIGALDIEALIAGSELAAAHAFTLREAKRRAEHLMSPPEEELAAELHVTGAAGWVKLHGNLSSQIDVELERDGGIIALPMSEIRNLAHEPDRDLRRRAFESEIAAWETVELPLAASLNGVKGQVNTLTARRGWDTPLDEALFQNRIDRDTLDAMLSAARESFPDFRRYLRAKARALGLSTLPWHDLFAPLGEAGRAWQWDEARDFLIGVFSDYSPGMGVFTERSFRERWIDAEPRPGKQDGAFCVPLRDDESRILANFKPDFSGVTTLAHELGHGYHNVQRAKRTILQQTTPMALAETASIFCETLVRDAVLRDARDRERVAILEASLQGSCQVVVDISSRFVFEQAIFEQRRERELSVDELNSLMLDAQRQTYGDGLDGDALHPYMWAVKSHYYSGTRSYYNYPYMFGQLFALGLYTRFQQEPSGFQERYDDLLSSTGLADPATLAIRFGIDIRTSEFWRSSLDLIRSDIDRFEALVDGAS